jgi:stage II sporulation protein D
MHSAVRRRTGRAFAVASVAAALLAGAAAEHAGARWVIKGRAEGHGVGMSQYGAYGFARKGRGHRRILGHYYADTRVGKTDGRPIDVLLTSAGAVRFTRATVACGRTLKSKNTYLFERQGSNIRLRRANTTLKNCGERASAQGKRTVKALGHGVYRGRLMMKLTGAGTRVINRVALEDYVRVVVANEVPSSWPAAVLRAQAVAARSYALATRRRGSFDHYDDARSQVYGGRRSETRPTNRAVATTRHEVVKHNGRIATTYFFSASGGETENVEFGFVGGPPAPYLKSVKDPYDGLSPAHRWTMRLSNSQMEARLSGLFSGNLRKIDATKRGISPRIVRVRVIGSSGGTKITGPALRARLGTRSTWMRFDKRG